VTKYACNGAEELMSSIHCQTTAECDSQAMPARWLTLREFAEHAPDASVALSDGGRRSG
jgi:hypothetical protein